VGNKSLLSNSCHAFIVETNFSGFCSPLKYSLIMFSILTLNESPRYSVNKLCTFSSQNSQFSYLFRRVNNSVDENTDNKVSLLSFSDLFNEQRYVHISNSLDAEVI
jgi:hypothetical protein